MIAFRFAKASDIFGPGFWFRCELEEDQEATAQDQMEESSSSALHRAPVDVSLLNAGILAGTTSEPLFLPEEPDTDPLVAGRRSTIPIDPALQSEPQPSTSRVVQLEPPTPIEASLDEALTQEVSSFLETAQGAQLSGALDDAEAQRAQAMEDNEALLGLDEDELDAFILTEEEVKMKERVWVEMNREYLENLAGMFVVSFKM